MYTSIVSDSNLLQKNKIYLYSEMHLCDASGGDLDYKGNPNY